MARHSFFCIDGHTCGNPAHLVAGGAPNLSGATMIEKRAHFLRENGRSWQRCLGLLGNIVPAGLSVPEASHAMERALQSRTPSRDPLRDFVQFGPHLAAAGGPQSACAIRMAQNQITWKSLDNKLDTPANLITAVASAPLPPVASQ